MYPILRNLRRARPPPGPARPLTCRPNGSRTSRGCTAYATHSAWMCTRSGSSASCAGRRPTPASRAPACGPASRRPRRRRVTFCDRRPDRPIVRLPTRKRRVYPCAMSIHALQPTRLMTTILGQSTKEYGHMHGAPAGGGFAALFASPTLVCLLRLFLARPDSDFHQRELALVEVRVGPGEKQPQQTDKRGRGEQSGETAAGGRAMHVTIILSRLTKNSSHQPRGLQRMDRHE